jgi:hypothetical protein
VQSPESQNQLAEQIRANVLTQSIRCHAVAAALNAAKMTFGSSLASIELICSFSHCSFASICIGLERSKTFLRH